MAVEIISIHVTPSVDDCHFMITPTWPDKLIVVPVPGHTLDEAANVVPPTLAGVTVTVATAEFTAVHPPLCTTAR